MWIQNNISLGIYKNNTSSYILTFAKMITI